MNNIEISFSPSINNNDSVIINGLEKEYNLNDINDTSSDLILLYMYELPLFAQHGIKIGMAKRKRDETIKSSLIHRIKEQKHELALNDEDLDKYGYKRNILFWGICLDTNSDLFKDYDVHDKILSFEAGIVEKEQEWFTNCHIDKLIKVFKEVRNKTNKKELFVPRKEQQDCINALNKYFDKEPNGRFLLNCKMRFGKSFTTYKYAEEKGHNRILILTFVPAVESSWREDLYHIQKDYEYLNDDNLRKDNEILNLKSNPFILFLSLQNYLGKNKDKNETKERIKKLQDVDWDLLILDEYHFGARNERTQKTIIKEHQEDLDKEYENELNKKQDIVKKFKIKTKETICLSGTPFKILAKGEFNDDAIFTYSYFDEQMNKYPNSKDNDFSVIDKNYAHFPDMQIFGYNMKKYFVHLTSSIFTEDKILNKKYFSLNKFFETRKDNNSKEKCVFLYEKEIKEWLNIICGKSSYGSSFPYSNSKISRNIKHTLWLLPTVNSCEAMFKLLINDDYFKKYQIINLSHQNVGAGVEAFEFLNREMTKSENNPNKFGSIALTVNKLTLGVTVKKWSCVFVLKDLASPEQYFQSIFRIQTPYVVKNEILKEKGYVFDFNIDRASALILKYAQESQNNETRTKLEIPKLIVKYMPIFVDGDTETPISEEVFYRLAELDDDSGTPLSKRIVNTERTTRILDDETMAAMLNDDRISDILKKIFQHAKFKSSTKEGNGIKPPPPDDGTNTEIGKIAREKGYNIGCNESDDYKNYDDNTYQIHFDSRLKELIEQNIDKNYKGQEKTWFTNSFTKGYEKGINAPIKKLQCGKEDGLKFVTKIKETFGEDIQYTKDTKVLIDNFVNTYLNDINNINEEYRTPLYRRWYAESFKRSVKNALAPKIQNKDGQTIESANNALKHILARLFQFLYISVYRETTFKEIFKNANPDVFLEAVGITKNEFEILNTYQVFQEDVLDNYIKDFFKNESLGKNIINDKNKEYYRNSFGWFGFNNIEKDVLDFANEAKSNEEQAINIQSNIEKVVEESYSFTSNLSSQEEPILEDSNNTLLDKIIFLLKNNPKGLSAKNIANNLVVSKKEINKVLYSNKDKFKESLFTWKIKD